MRLLNTTGLPFHHRCEGCHNLLQVEAGDLFRKEKIVGDACFRCIRCTALGFVRESSLGQGALIHASEQEMIKAKELEQIKAKADYIKFMESR